MRGQNMSVYEKFIQNHRKIIVILGVVVVSVFLHSKSR